MSQFEYVAIPVSLLVTFGIARLLGGFPHVLNGRRAYWVHTLWCATAILNLFFHWWAFWDASRVEEWTLGSYLWALLYPGLCYVGATVIVPAECSAETDWRAHFFRVRRSWFAVAAVATSTGLLTITLVAPDPASMPGVLLTIGFILLYVVGYLSASETTQGVVVLLNSAGVLAAYAPLIYRPLGS
jgi:hypothetical protein